jgi:hypothetical protein
MITLDVSVRERGRKTAARLGLSFSAYVEQLVREHLGMPSVTLPQARGSAT